MNSRPQSAGHNTPTTSSKQPHNEPLPLLKHNLSLSDRCLFPILRMQGPSSMEPTLSQSQNRSQTSTTVFGSTTSSLPRTTHLCRRLGRRPFDHEEGLLRFPEEEEDRDDGANARPPEPTTGRTAPPTANISNMSVSRHEFMATALRSSLSSEDAGANDPGQGQNDAFSRPKVGASDSGSTTGAQMRPAHQHSLPTTGHSAHIDIESQLVF